MTARAKDSAKDRFSRQTHITALSRIYRQLAG